MKIINFNIPEDTYQIILEPYFNSDADILSIRQLRVKFEGRNQDSVIELSDLGRDDRFIIPHIINYCGQRGYFPQMGLYLKTMYPPLVKALPFDEAG